MAAGVIQRAIGAARLDVATYEDVEADDAALGQSMAVVIVASLAGGIGSATASGGSGPGLVGGAIGALIAWFVWALTVYLVGTRLLPGDGTHADLGQVLRTTGFAAAPGIVGILGVLPFVGGLAVLVASLWQLVAMIVAVRQALDVTTGRAVAICVVGFIVQLVVLGVLFGLFVGGLAGIFGGGTRGVVP